jgi:hypothetical protein
MPAWRSPWFVAAALLLTLVGALLVLGLVITAQERLPPLSSRSATPSGAKALRLWLEALGYRVGTFEELAQRVPPRSGTVLLLAPREAVAEQHLAELERWVGEGGTLVFATDGSGGRAALGRLGFDLRSLPISAEYAQPRVSTLLDPAIGRVRVETSQELVPRREGSETLLEADGRAIAAVRPIGNGRLIALSAPTALSNRALQAESNARFALSLVGAPGGAVLFDELHVGSAPTARQDIWSLLFEHAWGQAALYAGLLALAGLALRGRRFGRAQPVAISRGRSLSEYVSSLAGLYRAGGKRAFIAEHFQRKLRRDLTHELGLPSDAPDGQVLDRARALGREPSGLLASLTALGRRGALGEGELVGLVRDAEQALARLRRSGGPAAGARR